MPALVVFDLDGTLVDSSRDLADSGNALLASYGQTGLPRDAIVRMVGDGARELVRRLLAAAGVDVPLDAALERFLALYGDRLLATTRPYQGVEDVLDTLGSSGCRLAVLTNKPADATLRVLEGLALDRYFADVIGGDGPFPRKPDPQGLAHLIARAGTVASETMMVGDSVADLRTAHAASVPACLARYGFGFAQVPADELAGARYLIDSPVQLLDVLITTTKTRRHEGTKDV